MVYFSRQVSKKITVSKVVEPSDKETWITLKHDVSQLKGETFSVESLRVSSSKSDTLYPVTVTWCQHDLVIHGVQLEKEGINTWIHGFASNDSNAELWSRERDVSNTLSHNVCQFFMSDLQVAYMKLMREICDRDGCLVECCSSGSYKELASVDCYIISKERSDGGDAIINFLYALSKIEETQSIYEMYSQPYLEALERNGITLQFEDDEPIPTFNKSYYIFPLDAVRKMLSLFQEIEVHNFIYSVPDNKEIVEPISFKICIPPSDNSITISATIEVLIGMMGTDDTCSCFSCQEEDMKEMPDVEFSTNPFILALSKKLDLENTVDETNKNLVISKGISSVRKNKYVKFELN